MFANAKDEAGKVAKLGSATKALRADKVPETVESPKVASAPKATKVKRSKKPKRIKGEGREKRSFPVVALEEAIRLPIQIKEKNGGNPWSPQDLAAAIGGSAKTTGFFYLTAGSRDYGLTEGTRYTA